MDLGLNDRVVFVGGASKGLGRAIALVLAEEHARLALTARDADALAATAAEATARGATDVAWWAADLTQDGEVARIVSSAHERFGTIDGLVNNVGGPEASPAAGFMDLDDAMWQRAFEQVVLIAVRTCRAVIPIMQANGRGSIVNIAGQAIRGHIPSMGQHESQKAAIAHVTKSLAKEFAPTIRVNAVLPGGIADERNRREVMAPMMAEHGWTEAEFVAHLNSKYYELTWSGRFGDPVEFANVVAFVLSDKASYMSGSWVNVDGGSGPG